MANIRCVLFSLLCIVCTSAQGDDTLTHEVSIADFEFLTGAWSGTGFGGVSEEIWMPPSGGRMFGIFKQSNDSDLVFTEFMEITEIDAGWILRLKHFNPDFTGWEEKDDYLTFPLTSVTEKKAVFGGLSYEIVDGGNLEVRLRMRQADGSTTTEVFNFAPVEL